MTTDLDNIDLTDEQSKALDFFFNFLIDPNMPVMRLSGYAGTGKSTLVRVLLKRLSGYINAWKLITSEAAELEVALTATTNKAAEALSDITGQNVSTIHSFLGLRLHKDYNTGLTMLVPSKKHGIKTNFLIFIDEASNVDPHLLELIFSQTKDCKIVFMGDKAQTLPVKFNFAPVFAAPFPEVGLTEVVRQAAGSPINTLATQFRETVSTNIWTPFTPDGDAVIHLPREEFDQEIMKEFNRKDWNYKDSKVLSYTNHRAIAYNNALYEHIKGTPDFREGDYAVCNNYIRVNEHSISTDALVRITKIEHIETRIDVPGRWVVINNTMRVFAPFNPQEIRRIGAFAVKNQNWQMQREVEQWIDLRAAFAQTINKAQGSTYDVVFIDIDDISTCVSGNQIARLMYVATSRARKRVYLTGDFG